MARHIARFCLWTLLVLLGASHSFASIAELPRLSRLTGELGTSSADSDGIRDQFLTTSCCLLGREIDFHPDANVQILVLRHAPDSSCTHELEFATQSAAARLNEGLVFELLPDAIFDSVSNSYTATKDLLEKRSVEVNQFLGLIQNQISQTTLAAKIVEVQSAISSSFRSVGTPDRVVELNSIFQSATTAEVKLETNPAEPSHSETSPLKTPASDAEKKLPGDGSDEYWQYYDDCDHWKVNFVLHQPNHISSLIGNVSFLSLSPITFQSDVGQLLDGLAERDLILIAGSGRKLLNRINSEIDRIRLEEFIEVETDGIKSPSRAAPVLYARLTFLAQANLRDSIRSHLVGLRDHARNFVLRSVEPLQPTLKSALNMVERQRRTFIAASTKQQIAAFTKLQIKRQRESAARLNWLAERLVEAADELVQRAEEAECELAANNDGQEEFDRSRIAGAQSDNLK